MDKVLNTGVLGNVWNWPIVWLMLALGLFIVHGVSRALPDLVPTEQ